MDASPALPSASTSPPWWMIVVQVIAGLIVVFLVYRLSLWLVHRDRLVGDRKTKDPEFSVKIVDGFAQSSQLANKSWNTIKFDARNYVDLPRSFNRKGGAQFSYSYWIYMDDVSNVKNAPILLRGNKNPYALTTTTRSVDGVLLKDNNTTDANKVLIKAPLIRFGNTYDELVVELNTLHNPNASITVKPLADKGGSPSLRHNILSLMQKKWALMTFVFEDHVAISDFEDGIMVSVYINDILYNSSVMSSAMRLNNGNLYLFPNGSISSMRLGDVTYYNYAIGLDKIRTLFVAGPPRHAAKDIDGRSSDPIYLAEYNKLDMYNY